MKCYSTLLQKWHVMWHVSYIYCTCKANLVTSALLNDFEWLTFSIDFDVLVLELDWLATVISWSDHSAACFVACCWSKEDVVWLSARSDVVKAENDFRKRAWVEFEVLLKWFPDIYLLAELGMNWNIWKGRKGQLHAGRLNVSTSLLSARGCRLRPRNILE